MKYLKQKTSGVFYYRRAVPTDLRDIIGKKEYGFSLKTKDKHIALERYVAADKQAEALFNSYSVDAQKSEKDRVAALQSISKAFGQSYMSAASKSDMTDKERLADAHAVAKEWEKQGKPTDSRFDANFGSIENKVTISDAFDFFIEHNSDIKNEKTNREYKKWFRPRELWVENFIKHQGDLPIEDISPKVVYDFKKNYLQRRIDAGEISPSTASKSGTYLRTIFECRNEELQLGLQNPFSTIKFSKVGGTRATIPVEQITDILLSKGYLDGLNTQAKALLLLMVNTGAGEKELIGLQAEDIKLDANIPHIVIRPNRIRKLKNGHRERTMPVLGVALEALRASKGGFPRYQSDNGSEALSACLNKYLKSRGYFVDAKQTAYSHRHGFKDRCRNAGFTDSLMDDLMGHAGKGPRYGEGYSLEVKAKELIKVAL